MEAVPNSAHQLMTNDPAISAKGFIEGSHCLFCGQVVVWRRTVQRGQLQCRYEQFYGARLPDDISRKYLDCEMHEFECKPCGLRWYTPNSPVESDYYEALTRTFPWYYEFDTWDKSEAVSMMKAAGICSFVDVGCGSGKVLEMASAKAIEGFGIDLNRDAVRAAVAKGLRVYLPDELPKEALPVPDAVCLLQTIEHVQDPVTFLQGVTKAHPSEWLVMSAPCHDSLLGKSRDPLSWPPHHFTSWTRSSFERLGSLVGYELQSVAYTPMSFWECYCTVTEHPTKFDHLPTIPKNRIGLYVIKLLSLLGISWVTRQHSILALFRRRL